MPASSKPGEASRDDIPSGDKVSVRSVFRAALHIAREKRDVPFDIEQTEDEL
jgi:hypothetical protein